MEATKSTNEKTDHPLQVKINKWKDWSPISGDQGNPRTPCCTGGSLGRQVPPLSREEPLLPHSLAKLGICPRGAWVPSDCPTEENKVFILPQVPLTVWTCCSHTGSKGPPQRGDFSLLHCCAKLRKSKSAPFNTCWLLRVQFLVLCLRQEVTILLMPWVTSSTLKLNPGFSWGPKVNQREVTSSYTDNAELTHETPVRSTTNIRLCMDCRLCNY